MKPTDWLQLFPGLDCEVIAQPTTRSGTTTNFLIANWDWWLLCCANYTLTVPGGGTASLGALNLQQGTISLGGWFAIAPTGVGTAEFICFSLLAGNANFTGIQNTIGIGFVPVVGEGSVQMQFFQGAGTTVIAPGNITIIGRKFRPKDRGY